MFRDGAIQDYKPKEGLAETARGSPSLVNGVRLRTSSLRGSRVRIPPPAFDFPDWMMRVCLYFDSLRCAAPAKGRASFATITSVDLTIATTSSPT